MGCFDGMLLVSDYDNTFQYTESALSGGGAAAVPPPSARNLEAVSRWIAGGGRFAIATGRSLGAFRQQAERLPINAPVIVDNGGGIYDLAAGRYVLRKLLPDCALTDLAAVEAAFPGTSMGLCRAAQLADHLPHEDYDMPVDEVVTEHGLRALSKISS